MAISLAKAIKERRLPEFIEQEEKRGVEATDALTFYITIQMALTPPRLADRTSHSPSDDGSSGK